MRDMVPAGTLEEMATYYRARAAEYDEWFYRQGRFDRGPEANGRWFAEAEEVFAALDALAPDGDVLELAPGTGIWTARLLRHARTITAIDASPEMIAINRAKVASDRVRYLLADLFAWRPDRRYDAVCFAFWISHVPDERLDPFLATVAAAASPTLEERAQPACGRPGRLRPARRRVRPLPPGSPRPLARGAAGEDRARRQHRRAR